MAHQKQLRLRAAWMRGGTSNGLFLNAAVLPPPGIARDRLLLAAMGPDPSGMQINGMGGGYSSTSKIVIVGKSLQAGSDVDYTFGQVSLREQRIEWDQQCGNLSAGVGPFAIAERLVRQKPEQTTQVRVWQTNTRSRMVVHVPPPCSQEQIAIPGVPGLAPPIYVEWQDLDVGHSGPVTENLWWQGSEVEVSLVKAGNSAVVVRGEDLGVMGMEAPLPWDEIDQLRAQAAQSLGIELTSGLRVILVGPPAPYTSSDGTAISAEDIQLTARITTDGHRVHHAFTGTGSLNLAAAAAVMGTVPAKVRAGGEGTGKLRFGHPGGIMEVQAEAEVGQNSWSTKAAGFLRTARFLMTGDVHLPSEHPSALDPQSCL